MPSPHSLQRIILVLLAVVLVVQVVRLMLG
jgi:hypothetical protein